MSEGTRSKPSPQGNPVQLAMAISILVFLFAFIAYQSYLLPQPIYAAVGKFLVKPYVQLGRTGDVRDLEIVWGSSDVNSKWELSSSTVPGVWLPSDELKIDRIALEGVPHFLLYHGRLKNVGPGLRLNYRVKRDDKVVFDSEIRPPKFPDQAHRFIVVGDTGTGSRGQRAVARKMYDDMPDVVLIAGDIVYQHGRVLEYLNRYFPVYNADTRSINGAPLLRSTLTVAAPGNHDTAYGSSGDSRDLDSFPDGLAYFPLWKQPLNGPVVIADRNAPNPRGSQYHRDAFYEAAGESYPRMNNFSFDYSNAHWTVLDANAYMNWQDKGLRDWVEQDILNAKKAKWHFVLFHQPAFNSDSHHAAEQQMRLMADVFERTGVDIVFAGHVHNYQRTQPIHFSPMATADGLVLQPNGLVPGRFDIDKRFDGVTNTKANGVIYIITGCGGAHLTGSYRAHRPDTWFPFTTKFISDYSYTLCDANDNRLLVRQVDTQGNVLDRFELTK